MSSWAPPIPSASPPSSSSIGSNNPYRASMYTSSDDALPAPAPAAATMDSLTPPGLDRTSSTATTIVPRISTDVTTCHSLSTAPTAVPAGGLTPTLSTAKPSFEITPTSTNTRYSGTYTALPRPSLQLPAGAGAPRKSISDIIVTMEATTPRGDLEAGDYCAAKDGRKSLQIDAWPARKQNEKLEMKKRRIRIAVKVVIAVVIVVGAVALGLGITKAVRDARKKE